MNTKDRRRSRDAERTTERLHYKFLTAYVKALHGDVHREAEELFEQAKQENPGVKDLTKTKLFMDVTMPNEPVPRHYTSERRKRLIRRHAKQVQSCMPRTMVLNIPLMQRPPSPSLMQTPPTTLQSSPPPMQTPPNTPLLLPPDEYKDLLDDLRRDPDLWKILNDLPLDDFAAGDMNDLPLDDFAAGDMNDLPLDDFAAGDMNDLPLDDFAAGDMNDLVAGDMGDAFMADDLTPLEIELEGAFDNIV